VRVALSVPAGTAVPAIDTRLILRDRCIAEH
jgi:hypothetical protein